MRFFAVLGVMFVHFSPGWLATYGPWGRLGVQTFFVLSGFLITHLLLDGRRRIETGVSTLRHELKHFFIRRILRLWPIYYLTLVVAAAVNVEYARSTFLWHAAFLSNYLVIHLGKWPLLMSHLWTLAVEQQFYIVWPLLIICLPRPWLPWLVLAVLIVGPIYRAIAVQAGLTPQIGVDLTLPSCCDLFGWGAALALWRTSGATWSNQVGRRALWLSIAAAAIVYGWYRIDPVDPPSALTDGWSGTVWGLASAALILHCFSDNDSPIRRVLRIRVFFYLGAISYGIYLYHNFSHWIAPRILRHLTGENYLHHEFPHVLYMIGLSVAISALSWHFIERPINNIRARL